MNVSAYCKGLDNTHQERYLSKISLLGIDPYLINLESCSTNILDFPKILYPDIVMYLVHTKSAYTMEEMKAYKSLEAYNQAVCGWVKKVCVKHFDSNILVLGNVMHSQRLNEKLLSPWIICKKDGTIISAHCCCIAGLGEVCTHVAAVLFSIDEVVRKYEEVTRTGIKAYWMPPSNKPVDPKRLHEIDLSTPKLRRVEDAPLRLREKENSDIPALSQQEKNILLSNLMHSRGSALHLITKPFSEEIKRSRDKRQNFRLLSLYKEDYKNKSLPELQEIGAKINIALDLQDCEAIEIETRSQSKCRPWFIYRKGRITASKFKKSCRTNLLDPSLSLIKDICYSTSHQYKIKALEYGYFHEKEAVNDFLIELKKKHQNVRYEKMGLCINPKYPYFGASPDGQICCDCCGIALIEVKCPYCARHTGVSESYKNSILEKRGEKWFVRMDHEYYYQVQMQLALTERDFCYLVIWSKKNFIHVSVPFDEPFWIEKSEEAKKFVYKVILPEVLGRYFTKKEMPQEFQIEEEDDWEVFSDVDVYQEVIAGEASTEEGISPPLTNTKDISILQQSESSGKAERKTWTIDQPGSSKPRLYCVCQKEDDHITPMIACDGPYCQIEWYHLVCVGLGNIPNGKWLCNMCKL